VYRHIGVKSPPPPCVRTGSRVLGVRFGLSSSLQAQCAPARRDAVVRGGACCCCGGAKVGKSRTTGPEPRAKSRVVVASGDNTPRLHPRAPLCGPRPAPKSRSKSRHQC
jgi:hypothetical protein